MYVWWYERILWGAVCNIHDLLAELSRQNSKMLHLANGHATCNTKVTGHGPYRIKLTFMFLKSAARHSQGSVRAPHGLENRRASDAQSVNVRKKDVDRRLICEHVRKPLCVPRPLILDLTTSTVEANSLRHPQGGAAIATVFGRKQTARRIPYVTMALHGL